MTDDRRQPSRARALLATTEGFLWLALLTSCLAVLLFVRGGPPGAAALLELQGRAWWGWFVLFYVAIGLAMASLAVSASLILRRLWVSRFILQGVSLAVLVAVLVLNRSKLTALIGRGSDSTWAGMAALASILALLSVAALVAGLSDRRPWVLRALGLLSVAACFLVLRAPEVEARERSASIPAAVSTTGERLLVMGLDGADWDFLDPLMARGLLPNLRSLKEAGVWGDLKTLRPTRSAPIWTSVVTGVEPQRHGVINNSVERLGGSYRRLPKVLPLPQGLGAGYLESRLRAQGYIAPSTVASFDRRVPAFWNIATSNDSPIDFVNWWASWPVEQIRGHMVSDRAHFWRLQAKGFSADRGYVTYPDGLLFDLTELIMRPDQVTHADALQFMEVSVDEFEEMKTTPYQHHRLKSEFKYLYSMFISNLRVSRHLMEIGRRDIGRPSDMFVLFRIIDQASHQALEYSELVTDHLQSAPGEVEKYSRVVTEAYRAADRAVGDLVRAFGDGNVVVLSDHGFKLLRKRRRHASYDHFGGSPPDGIFIAAGPAFGTGTVEGLGVYDMMPLFLALKGWPVAEDFVRGVPEMVFEESFLEQHPIETIDSYGTMSVSLPAEGPIVADDEMIERLRALGYLD